MERFCWQQPAVVSEATTETLTASRDTLQNLSSGTYLLAGPSYTGKRNLALEFISAGDDASNAGIVISPVAAGSTIRSQLVTQAPTSPTNQHQSTTTIQSEGLKPEYSIIDCRPIRTVSETEDDCVRYAPSPGDFTTIGVRFLSALDRLDGSNRTTMRVSHLSLSTAFIYADERSVIAFVSNLREILNDIGGAGLFVFNPLAHDESIIEELINTVDGVVTVPDNNSEC